MKMKFKVLKEDTVKQDNHWVNKGKEGTHGKFRTKKEADAQRKAMFAQGFKEDISTEEAFIENEDDWGNDDFDKADEWKFVKSKEVVDSDGFTTEYVWYKGVDPDTDKPINIFMFGDSDLYEPSIEDADWIEYDDLAAREWFDNYESGYLSTDELEDQEEAEWEETKKKWAEEDEEFFSDKHWDEMDSLSKDDFEEDLKFVDNRKNAILGKGDDPGFDEYDLVDNDEEEFTDEDDLDESTLQEKKHKPAEVKSMIGIRGDMDNIVEDTNLEESSLMRDSVKISDDSKLLLYWEKGYDGGLFVVEKIYKPSEHADLWNTEFKKTYADEESARRAFNRYKAKFLKEDTTEETKECEWCGNKFNVKKDSDETLCPKCRYGVRSGAELEESKKEPTLWDGKYKPEDITVEYISTLDTPDALRLLKWYNEYKEAEKSTKETKTENLITEDGVKMTDDWDAIKIEEDTDVDMKESFKLFQQANGLGDGAVLKSTPNPQNVQPILTNQFNPNISQPQIISESAPQQQPKEGTNYFDTVDMNDDFGANEDF